MSKSIYVGNLPWSATEDEVQALFAEYGKVLSGKLVKPAVLAVSVLLKWTMPKPRRPLRPLITTTLAGAPCA